MKKLYLIISMLFVALMGVAKAEVIQIGSDNYTDYYLPVNTYYNYSLTQQIYTAEEIGRSGYITDLSFYYAYSGALNMEGIQVYLFHTSKSSFSSNADMISVSAPTNLYFEGTFSASVSGWVTLTLDRPFNYNGTSNLVVCFYDPTSGFPGSAYKFRHTSTSDNKSITYYSDGTCPDLSTLTSFNGNKQAFSYRSNIRFHFYDPETQPYETTIQMGFESEQSYQLPVNMYYNYSMTQQIYRAAQIGSRGTIYTIGFDYAYTGSFSMEGVKVYMKNVKRQYFNTTSDYVEVTESDKVFEGTFSATGPGWVMLTLDTPFEYDGISNLLVCFLDQTYGYPGSSYKFNCSTATYSSLAYYSDSNSNIPNLSNLSGYNGSKEVVNYRANMRLGFTSGSFLQIGEGTDSGYYLPTTTFYNYSLTQQIFTANEIGTAGTIHSLSFQYAHTEPLLMTGLQVYLKHVDKTTFSNSTDMVSISASDLVYQGSLSASGSGWTTLTLDTPFDYDGTSNLLVCVYDPNYGYPGSAYKFYYTSTSGYTSLVYYSDTYVPDITNVSSFSGSKTRPLYRSNIRFGITPTVNIGTGTSTSCHVPFCSLYNYSFVEQIYTADEIGTEGLINSISFYNTSNAQTNLVTVYMKNVSRSRFASTSDYEAVSPSDVVFEGNWTLNQGWSTITLTNPFEYDGTSNLLIAIDENTPGWAVRYFTYTEKEGAALEFKSDDYNPDPYDLASFNGGKKVWDFHANLQLDILPFGEDYCHKPQNLTVTALPNSIVMDWDTEGNSWLVFWKAATGTTPASGQWGEWVDPPLTITQYKPYGGNWTNLEPGATYEYMIAVQCSDGSDSHYTPLAQVTLPEESSFPIDFETGYLNQFPFNNNVSEYPWVVTDSDAANGTYCMMSSNQGKHSSTSAIEAMYFFEEDGYVSFDAKCMGEGSSPIYDACTFYIDDEAQFTYGAHGDTWDQYVYTVTAGTHTFRWEYTKDYSVHPNGDTFYVDDIDFETGSPCFAPTKFTVAHPTLTSTTLTWDGFAASYTLSYRKTGGGSWITISNLTSNTYTINDLVPGTYMAHVWATCDADHWATTYFTIKEILSTADWYGFVQYANGNPEWTNSFIRFNMQNPVNVTSVSNTFSSDDIYCATYVNGYVWYINVGDNSLNRAPFDLSTHTIGDTEVLQTGFETAYATGMSYNPIDGKIYYITNGSPGHLKSFDPDDFTNVTTIGEIETSNLFAINNEGIAYLITFDKNLHVISLADASTTTLVGNTGIDWMYTQSMAFDMETGELFWAQILNSDTHNLYKVNTVTAECFPVGKIGNVATELTGLFMVPSINEAPVEADFETGDLSQLIFNNSVSSYPWEVTNSDAASGSYCMRSTNQGVASSTSAIEATCHFSENGYVAFDAKCMGESGDYVYDACEFFIDDEAQFSYGDQGNTWNLYAFTVTAGTHTFRWQYSKDSSVNPEGDTFYVDNLIFGLGAPCFAPTLVRAMDLTLSSATMEWDGFASSFKLRYRLVGGSWTTKSNLTGNTYTINNLAPGNYQVQVWATCDESHKVSTNFTITEVLSTAEWYGYVIAASSGLKYKYVQFTMQNPGTLTAVSDSYSLLIDQGTFANGFDMTSHTVGTFEVLATAFDTELTGLGSMSYNPVDGRMYYTIDNVSNTYLKSFDPDNISDRITIGEIAFGCEFTINQEGTAYCIGYDNNLYTVNLNNASTTLVGNLGISFGMRPTWQTSMAFDMETGELFWIKYYSATQNGAYKINTSTGVATYIRHLGAQINGLFMVPPMNEAPVEADFETGDLSQLIFNNSVSSYPWEVTNSDAGSGSYCMRSTNQGVANSTSAIEATCHFSEDGYVAFDAKCMGESITFGSIVAVWDGCTFYIDNVAQFSYGNHGNNWDLYVFEVTAGIHTFRWEYDKDDETDPDGDTFYVDNLNFGIGSPCFAPTYVMLTQASLSSATLKWDGVASTYKLRYKKVGGSWTTKSNLTDHTYTINNLAPGNYQAQVWATCDESHKVSTNFTITEVLSTAEWYGYAVNAYGGEDWENKFVQFSVQTPGNVTAASSTLETYIWAATYANGYVWGFTQDGNLFRAPFNYDTHTIGNMEILATGFESRSVGGMAYNPIDGKIYFHYHSYDESCEYLRCFDPNHYATITTIGEFDYGLLTFINMFAINKYGVGYLIGRDANLYTIDLTDASLSLVGSTMQRTNSLQSMAFDMETDELIWAQYWSPYENALYKVDTETGFATSIGLLGSNGAQLTGLFMLPNAEEQTIALENGWKWISSYVAYDGNSLSNLENAISTSAVNAATIKSQTSYRTYEGGSWYGVMSGLENENMYMVQLDRNLTVTFSGSVVNPAEHPLTLSKGWKWISFLSPTTMSLENALVNLNCQADDVIKGQGGFSTYSGTGWVGSLKNLEPGRGYMYENNSNTVKTFTYPSAGKAFVTDEEAETFWKSDIHAFAHNLCMMVSVEDLALSEGSHEIGAFVNGECRGSARIQTVEGFDTPMAFLTVTGTEGETVSFKVLDAHTGMEMGNAVERIPFTNDAVYGRLSQPYLLHLDANGVDSHHDEVSLFPNPTKDKVRLQASDIQMVKLFNAMGQCLYSEEFDHATEVELDLSSFSAGVYTLSVRTCNGKTANRKVVKD